MDDGPHLVDETTRTALPRAGRRDGWLERRLSYLVGEQARLKGGVPLRRFLRGAIAAYRRFLLSRLTPPTAFTAGRPCRRSARGWTGSNAEERVIRSPEPHRTARTLNNHWWIDPIEPNAGLASLCPVTSSRFVGGGKGPTARQVRDAGVERSTSRVGGWYLGRLGPSGARSAELLKRQPSRLRRAPAIYRSPRLAPPGASTAKGGYRSGKERSLFPPSWQGDLAHRQASVARKGLGAGPLRDVLH
jgi:hypothetical protein